MNKYNNQKAREFFGDEIVNNLEQQHQDSYPSFYKIINKQQFQFGNCVEYIVPFKGKNYKVTIQDNILINPLYINQITNWIEYKELNESEMK